MTTTILVAGAGKGIGKATADLAHEKGYEIIAVSRNKADLLDRPYITEVADLEDVNGISLLEKYASKVRIVVNCTGTHPGIQQFGEDWGENVKKTVDQNLIPALYLYKAFLPEFRRANGGLFIHLSSGALDFYDPSEAGYCASKAALEALVLSLQNENPKILHRAVRVSLTDTPLARRVCPGITDWGEFYTSKEVAAGLIDIIARPAVYPKVIVPLPYRPVR